ncbi:MAG: hypothetical protein WC552_03485 [Candidatus Omnitrophota bacterium]
MSKGKKFGFAALVILLALVYLYSSSGKSKWLMHRNRQLGYQILYPADWNHQTILGKEGKTEPTDWFIQIGSPQGNQTAVKGGLLITRYKNQSNLSLEDVMFLALPPVHARTAEIQQMIKRRRNFAETPWLKHPQYHWRYKYTKRTLPYKIGWARGVRIDFVMEPTEKNLVNVINAQIYFKKGKYIYIVVLLNQQVNRKEFETICARMLRGLKFI